MNIFFTSDQHFSHKRICEFSKRPYADVTEMREDFIKRHNEVVKPGDLVYHLGDFSFADVEESTKIARRLNGQRYLIFGNHDKRLRKERDFLAQWIWAKDFAEIKIGDQKIVLCHYPLLTWGGSHKGSWNLHGHCHGSLPEDKHARRVDVGVDCWDYRPAHFDEIYKVMSIKEFRPIDHHGARDFEQ